jgi:adenylosuccinate lyase
MACVHAGLSRQDAHEEVRVLSHEAAAVVKKEGKTNDLLERVRRTKFFEPILPQLDALLDSSTFIGRAPQQVDRFLREEIEPAVQRYKGKIAASAGEVKV